MTTPANDTNTKSSGQPIMQRKFPYKKSEMGDIDVVAGLDRGCSLTKIIYVDKADANTVIKGSTTEFVMLTVVLFPNSEFRIGLKWMRDHGVFPEDKSLKVHVTGAGGVKYVDDIKEILPCDIQFIDEFLSQSRGAFYLLSNVPMKDSLFPMVEPLEEYKLEIPYIQKLRKQFEKVVGPEVLDRPKEQIFPCVFGFLGSGGGFTFIGENGKFKMVAGLPTAGKTFVGMSRCILGTNKYDEIMKMAERGNRKNVDLQMSDVVNSEMNWDFSSTLPIFNLGKLAETKKGINEFNKDDIAHSLVSIFAFNVLNSSIYVAMSEKVNNVFIGGNLFQGSIFRREFESIRRTMKVDFINFYFVNNGHTGALGAMLSKTEDMGKYFEM